MPHILDLGIYIVLFATLDKAFKNGWSTEGVSVLSSQAIKQALRLLETTDIEEHCRGTIIEIFHHSQELLCPYRLVLSLRR